MVKVKTKKGTYALNKNEFVKYMYNLWEKAQTKKLVQAEIKAERKTE